MKLGISDRIVKPHNCVVVFGIPTSKEDFLRDQNHPNKEFAKDSMRGDGGRSTISRSSVILKGYYPF